MARITLTGSQQSAASMLLKYYTAFRKKSSIAGFSIRPPLIIGPSGSGKTTIARALAAFLDLPYKLMSSSSWLIQGAKEPNAVIMVLDFLRQHEQGLILINEMDKFGSNSWENWWKEVQEECMQLCERRVESWRNWTRDDVQKLRNSFFVVGIGTFQHLFRRAKKIEAFGASTKEVLEEIDFGQLVRDGGLAEELLARFSEPIFVAAPSYSDFCSQIERIHTEAGIPLSQTQKYSLASQAVQSGKAVRWLEDYASLLLLSRIQTKRMPAVITIGAAYTREKPWSPEEIE